MERNQDVAQISETRGAPQSTTALAMKIMGKVVLVDELMAVAESTGEGVVVGFSSSGRAETLKNSTADMKQNNMRIAKRDCLNADFRGICEHRILIN